MSAYDCGAPDCWDCHLQFGPDRSKAIANHAAREQSYSKMERLYAAELAAVNATADLLDVVSA